MSYRPITDVWILARSKQKYYGSYPAGFLHRARALLGVSNADPVLHVCSGAIRQYPYRGLGRNDKLLDLNPVVNPDFLQDAREPFPPCKKVHGHSFNSHQWAAVLIDRPYTEADADRYVAEGLEGGSSVLPSANLLVKNGIAAVSIGGKVGILDYLWPQPPKNAVEVAVIGVGTGRNSRARWFSVFERLT